VHFTFRRPLGSTACCLKFRLKPNSLAIVVIWPSPCRCHHAVSVRSLALEETPKCQKLASKGDLLWSAISIQWDTELSAFTTHATRDGKVKHLYDIQRTAPKTIILGNGRSRENTSVSRVGRDQRCRNAAKSNCRTSRRRNASSSDKNRERTARQPNHKRRV
jgi:hypothetical protein